ncbi:MAG: EamA/RhaT family transporter, partial [Cohaesibacter sp.]|nr:EamA/RhaT family transporter [Cohaesibacter sp.]
MDNWKGAAYMVLSMAAFTLEDALIKAIAVRLPVGEILILFGAGGAFIFACLAGLQKQSPVSRAMMSRTMLIRSFFEICGRLFYALAIALSPLSSASAILQATPLVVAAG